MLFSKDMNIPHWPEFSGMLIPGEWWRDFCSEVIDPRVELWETSCIDTLYFSKQKIFDMIHLSYYY